MLFRVTVIVLLGSQTIDKAHGLNRWRGEMGRRKKGRKEMGGKRFVGDGTSRRYRRWN